MCFVSLTVNWQLSKFRENGTILSKVKAFLKGKGQYMEVLI